MALRPGLLTGLPLSGLILLRVWKYTNDVSHMMGKIIIVFVDKEIQTNKGAKAFEG